MAPPRTSFHTTGERVPYDHSYIVTNQTYVQYFPPTSKHGYNHYVPEKRRPLVFIHGGGLTGAIAPDELRSTAGSVGHRTAKKIWDRFRIGPVDGYDARRVFEGGQFPVEAFDALVGGQSARRWGNDEMEAKGIVDAITKIGDCEVIAHSHGAALIIDVLDNIGHLVKDLALVEPGGTASAGNLIPSVRTVVYWGDYLDTLPAWVKIAAPYDTTPTEVVRLPEMGVKGNSHFPMLDRNSDQVFKVILTWLNSGPNASKVDIRDYPLPSLWIDRHGLTLRFGALCWWIVFMLAHSISAGSFRLPFLRKVQKRC
ncbi:hypothetical protein Vi05172_g12961 [Venturia inaequalis]|nr:hypothetical protein Vi05172_g12961 [Venturia inaequalis]